MKVIESHIVPELTESIRLQEYAHIAFQNLYSRSASKKSIKKELILIDGKIGETGSWIESGQQLELLQQENHSKVFNLKFPVVFENEEFAIINKPPGYPTNGNYFKTIQNALPFNLKISLASNALSQLQPVHRLDTPTSGLLIVAKTISSQQYFYDLWENNNINKTYHAVVEGFLTEAVNISAEIDGKEAQTFVSPISSNENFSLLRIEPKTGRTHQIRKHLSNINLPIVGDVQYGSNISLSRVKGICLAATGLQFPEEYSVKMTRIDIEIPELFRKYL